MTAGAQQDLQRLCRLLPEPAQPHVWAKGVALLQAVHLTLLRGEPLERELAGWIKYKWDMPPGTEHLYPRVPDDPYERFRLVFRYEDARPVRGVVLGLGRRPPGGGPSPYDMLYERWKRQQLPPLPTHGS